MRPSQNPKIYVDNNATTSPLPEVIEAMCESMTRNFGNPSSSHRDGELARRTIAVARQNIANMVGAVSSNLIFTSGATEANNWALQSGLAYPGIARLVTTPAEHSSVKRMPELLEEVGNRTVLVRINSDGRIDLGHLKEICGKGPALVSTHWVNNETGVIQDISEIAKICHQNRCVLHVDASQAIGKLKIDFDESTIDFLTITSHKMHGPQGVGALCVKETRNLTRFLCGGEQEKGLRPGTENLPGIAGFGRAAEIRASKLDSIESQVCALRDQFEEQVFDSIAGVHINGGRGHRIYNTSNLLFQGVDGQALVAQLDADGVRCSQSSACTAQIPEPSYVLTAMGLSEQDAYSSVRFSFSELNTREEISLLVGILTKRVRGLRDTFQTMVSHS